ncbi:hypothetical protein [Nostoc sp. FACHB-190]|nr:hypothetical protein [Nostoc sp. FACHB-190]
MNTEQISNFLVQEPFSSFLPLRPWRSWRFVSISMFFTTHLGLL